MSRAEEKALDRYPRENDAWGDEWQKRVGFQEGYEQAEKDFMEKALWWLECNLSDRPTDDIKFWLEDFKQAMSELK